MKKALSIFFCFYFVALMAKPCADKADCNEFDQTKTSQSEHHKDHADEICTPFCVCSCCSTNILVTDYSHNLIDLTLINTVYKDHEDSKISSIIISIWQPPKLG